MSAQRYLSPNEPHDAVSMAASSKRYGANFPATPPRRKTATTHRAASQPPVTIPDKAIRAAAARPAMSARLPQVPALLPASHPAQLLYNLRDSLVAAGVECALRRPIFNPYSVHLMPQLNVSCCCRRRCRCPQKHFRPRNSNVHHFRTGTTHQPLSHPIQSRLPQSPMERALVLCLQGAFLLPAPSSLKSFS